MTSQACVAPPPLSRGSATLVRYFALFTLDTRAINKQIKILITYTIRKDEKEYEKEKQIRYTVKQKDRYKQKRINE